MLFPHLDERQRRLLMGVEARILGHGGIRAVAWAAQVSETTIRIEHRLFSHISMNWRGRPLTSHNVIVNSIAGSTDYRSRNSIDHCIKTCL